MGCLQTYIGRDDNKLGGKEGTSVILRHAVLLVQRHNETNNPKTNEFN